MKSKPAVILGITFLLVAGIVFLFIWPVASSIWQSWQGLKETKANLKEIEETKQVLNALKNNQQLANVGEIAKKYLPEDQEAGQLVIELTAMAEANHLKVEQTTLEKSKEEPKKEEETAKSETKKSPTPTPGGSPTPAEKAKTVDFTVKISGTFADFMNFLKSIETSSRLIAVKDIAMESKAEKDKPTAFSAQMTGSAYYKKEVTLEKNLENLKLAQETLDRFFNLKTYGQPINLTGEEGFGRTNPFENY